jgi:hypothetical protein
MHFKQKLVAFMIALLMAINLSGQTATNPGGPVTLQSAATAGKVEYTFNGTGASSGDSIRLKVKKAPSASSEPITVTVPPGSVLRSSSAGAQSMVVGSVHGIDLGGGRIRPTSQIYLSGDAPVTVILTAFCSEFEKDNPSSYTTFSLEKPDPMLSCIMRESQNLPLAARQAAVWIYTDRVSYSHMSEKFPVDPGEFSAGEAVVGRCRATVQ